MREMSRRGFFGLAAATAGGAVVLPLLSGVAQAAPAASDTKTIWKLDPDPRACNACLGHAKNKRFADEPVANTHRAHKGCRCTTASAETIAAVAYEQLFKDTDVVDLRDKQTAELVGTGGGSSVPVSMAAALPLAVLLGGGAAGFYYWNRRKERSEAVSAAATPAPPGSPTPPAPPRV